MKKTVGTIDRVIRVVVAIAAVIAAFSAGASTAWGIVLLIAALILLVTGLSGYCPIYSALNIDTLSSANKPSSGHRVAH
ncbi:MAG: DUF2892 domain-containing protein [Actinomycetota bacterium]|nr:MAG: DUF2892 domain-containing protein [Actinomycetota bacterium]